MAIICFCDRCNHEVECETKAEMVCDCGYSIKDHDDTRNHVNMRTTWSGTTQIEFSNTTIEEDINRRNNG